MLKTPWKKKLFSHHMHIIHHSHSIAQLFEKTHFFFSSSFCSQRERVKLSHSYNTRASHQKRKMDQLEQENRELREEVTTLKDTMERLSLMVETLTAAQNRLTTPLQRTVISKIVSSPIVGVPVNAPQYQMSPNRPWGMPINFMPEGYIPPVAEVTRATVIPEGYRPQDVGGTSVRAVFPEGYRPQDVEG